MIPEIRQFFNDQVVKIDPLLEAYDRDIFGDNDISLNVAEKYYNLIIGVDTPNRDANWNADAIDVNLDIYSAKGIDLVDDFDHLYDKAILIKDELVKMANFGPIPCIDNVVCNDITPIEENTNDNVFRMRLNFTVERFFSL